MFTIAKICVALMAATVILAAPNKRGILGFDDVTCTFLMVPDAVVSPGSINLDREFNFVVARILAEQVPDTTIESDNISTTDNGDNTFTVVRSDGVDGKTAAQTATVLTGLVGVTNNGFANDAEFNWTFESISCDA